MARLRIKVILKNQIRSYFFLSIILLLNLGCKTTNSTAPKVEEELSEQSLVCEQTFTSDEKSAVEKYTYTGEQRIKSERFDEKGNLLFTENATWEGSKMQTQNRVIANDTVFSVRYVYEGEELKKKEIDDTDEEGNLLSDGKADREERFFYEQVDGQSRLTKIEIERENHPILITKIEYKDGLESTRTTMSGDKSLEVQTHFYKHAKKTKSLVELPDGEVLEYQYSYDEEGRLLETKRSSKGALLSWVSKYDCK